MIEQLLQWSFRLLNVGPEGKCRLDIRREALGPAPQSIQKLANPGLGCKLGTLMSISRNVRFQTVTSPRA
jgi:hypothetical protein